ncbi:MAG TPA: glycine cleavage T C-terminal barrel domain-containing protein [Gemmataceae bacterium]|jgi:folate-binding protein YgfZ
MREPTPLHDIERAAGAGFAEVAGWLVPVRYGDATAEYERARGSAALFDISHRGKVELGGSDVPSFVHNLSTNDVLNLPLGAGCEAFFTTAKAKVIAHALVYHVRIAGGRDALWLDVAPGQATPLIQHLDHFLIAEQVEMADRTADFAQFHLAGPRAKEVLERALGEPVPDLGPLQHMERTFGEHATCHVRRHDPLGLPGYDLVCLTARAVDVWQRLTAAGAGLAGLDAYEVLRVEAGTPVYGADIDENRFVVEVGRTDAICYTKGCYLGQEPIVMARDRAGHVNRTFRGLKLSAGGVVPAGARLITPEGKDVGVVTSSVVSPRLGPIALAYIRRGSDQPGTALEVEPAGGGHTAVVAELPMTA